MQALTGLFAGLLTRVEPFRAAIRQKVAAFSPVARWRHVIPTPVTHSLVRSRTPAGNGDDAVFTQEGLVVAVMLRPASTHTLMTHEEYRSAIDEATGRTPPLMSTWESTPLSSPKWTPEQFAEAEKKLRIAKRSNEDYDAWYRRTGQRHPSEVG